MSIFMYAVFILTFRIRMDGTGKRQYDQPLNNEHFNFISEGSLDRLYGDLDNYVSRLSPAPSSYDRAYEQAVIIGRTVVG